MAIKNNAMACDQLQQRTMAPIPTAAILQALKPQIR
jgi:hypothetical protein